MIQQSRRGALEQIRGIQLSYLFIGAGEEIRTLDPNLGKVVLYP